MFKFKTLAITFVLFLVAVGIFFAFNSYIYKEKQGSGLPVEPYDATLSGTFTCLPHKDTSGPQTLECAFALQTDTGEYYALDFGADVSPNNFVGGQRATLRGLITPIEFISSDHWQKYNVTGIFSVKEIL